MYWITKKEIYKLKGYMDKTDILKDNQNVKLFESKNYKDLLESNVGLVYKILKTHGIDQTRQNFADVKQAGIIGLWNAINTWNPKKSKLSTHAHYAIRKQVQNEIARSYVISLGKHNSGKTCYQSFIDHKKGMEVLHLDAIITEHGGKTKHLNNNPVQLKDALSHEVELQNLKTPLQHLIDGENSVIIKKIYKKVMDNYYKFLNSYNIEADGTELEIFSTHASHNPSCVKMVKKIWVQRYKKELLEHTYTVQCFYQTVHYIRTQIRKGITLGDVI